MATYYNTARHEGFVALRETEFYARLNATGTLPSDLLMQFDNDEKFELITSMDEAVDCVYAKHDGDDRWIFLVLTSHETTGRYLPAAYVANLMCSLAVAGCRITNDDEFTGSGYYANGEASEFYVRS